MAHDITVTGETKEEKYRSLVPQIKALLEGEDDMIARMANTAAAIHFTFGFLWTGFYRVSASETGAGGIFMKGDKMKGSNPGQLVAGPFQGPVACSRIAYGKGVCGSAWKEGRTLVVPDVEQFPGHIRCSSEARSEIVVPVFSHQGKEIIAVLDIDSARTGTFDLTDAAFLEQICSLLCQ